ncbi:hypothetical protein BJ875DRAFT_109309 [Amylocarpus encephaloides]|uniref:5'-3' DNA helicase ZGRF1-like N-terminal domain-containing protein n=1 Tax=Amylocarpus encephaloides TaxID=45428 RepID=A0A9P7YQ93_9HELO|nr:hypothetical protein BJ875DRAFT_109309 [Amylocarpus encephaloides]
MTAPVSVPHTQNTAPVIEFRCLYSTDLKRKQKRWQDGRLKFHTFNKKIMVYDEKSNLIGDAHWREDGDLDEGDELSLERGGTLIQVEDKIGVQAQDLTELVDKRVKEKEARAAARSGAVGFPASIAGRTQSFGAPGNTLKLKSLNALLTPSGHHGKALLSTESPFEERRRLNHGNQENPEKERSSKRRRPNEPTQDKSGYARNLTGTMLTLASSKPSSTPTIRYERLKTNLSVPRNPPIEIDLTAGDESADEPTRTREKIVREAPGGDMRKSKVQKTRSKRAPPASNGYASNLTGVALSLCGPPRASTISRAREPTGKKAHNSWSEDDSSSESDLGNQGPAHKKSATHHTRTENVNAPRRNCRSPSKEKSLKLSSSREEDVTTTRSSAHEGVAKTIPPKPPVMQAGTYGMERQRPKDKVSVHNSRQRSITSREKTTKNNPPSREVTREPSHSFSSDTLISQTNRSALQTSSRRTAESLKPRSSLKLKPKRLQQMMMLTRRPGPRPSVSNSYGTASKVQKRTTDARKEAAGSKPIVDVDSFVQRQESLMLAQLSRKQPQEQLSFGISLSSMANNVDVPLIRHHATGQHEKPVESLVEPLHEKRIQAAPSSDITSSLLDSGIGHNQIHNLLSHSMGQVTFPTEIIFSGPSISTSRKSSETLSLQEATSKKTSNPSQKSPTVQKESIRAGHAVLETLNTRRTTSLNQSKDALLAVGTTNMETLEISGSRKSGAPTLSTSPAAAELRKTTQEGLSDTLLPNIVEEAKVTSTPIFDRQEGNSMKSLASERSALPLPIAPQKPVNNALKNLTPKAQRSVENVTEALKNTDEHFRAIVRASPHNSPQSNEDILRAGSARKAQEPKVDRPTGPEQGEPENQPPRPMPPAADLHELDRANTPIMAALDSTSMGPPNGMGFRLTNSFGSKWAAPDPPEFALSIPTVNQPKFRLSKPTPRPVTLASGPGNNSNEKMLPPRSGCLGHDRDNDMFEGMPVTVTGPWSREAFDLFGNWRPPDKPAAA